MGIEPETLAPWHLSCLHSHAFPTEFTWPVLIEGYSTSLGLTIRLTDDLAQKQ